MSIDLKTPVWLILLSLAIMNGCDDGAAYRQSDGRTLCDPVTREAFAVERHGGFSRVTRRPDRDSLCRLKRSKLTRLASN